MLVTIPQHCQVPSFGCSLTRAWVPPMSKIRSCGQSNPVVKHCSAAAACRGMAGYGFKDRFKLIQATPQNGKADPNPRVECLLCGIVFSGGVTGQRNHLLAQKGRDVRICTEIASLEPDLLAELQHEQQQKQEQQQMRRMLSLTLELPPP